MRESEERIAKLFAFVRRWQPARQDIALLSENRALQTSVSFRGAERRISDSMKWRVHTSSELPGRDRATNLLRITQKRSYDAARRFTRVFAAATGCAYAPRARCTRCKPYRIAE